MARYSPRKGEFLAISVDPQASHEQRGRRPALVISNDLFNDRTGFCIMCPITSTNRGFPFHVAIPDGLDVTGTIVVEQVKSLDFRSRGAKRIGAAPQELLNEVLALLDASIF